VQAVLSALNQQRDGALTSALWFVFRAQIERDPREAMQVLNITAQTPAKRARTFAAIMTSPGVGTAHEKPAKRPQREAAAESAQRNSCAFEDTKPIGFLQPKGASSPADFRGDAMPISFTAPAKPESLSCVGFTPEPTFVSQLEHPLEPSTLVIDQAEKKTIFQKQFPAELDIICEPASAVFRESEQPIAGTRN
jgi:hypothetical protein